VASNPERRHPDHHGDPFLGRQRMEFPCCSIALFKP
jgi:hypothetical protein